MLPRLAFYPTLAYNVVLERLGFVSWYNRIDETVILGALPFVSIANKVGHRLIRRKHLRHFADLCDSLYMGSSLKLGTNV